MLGYKKQSFLIGFIMMLALLLVACQSETPTAAPQGSGISVEITADTCPNVVLNINQQVTWTNQDTKEHIVRDKTAAGTTLFDSDILQPGDSFSYTFGEAATYTYDCSTDGSMTGTITVE